MNFENFLIDFEKAKETEKIFSVITLVGHKGSIPQEMGARLIVNEQGYFSGTIGGGKLEKAAIEKAQVYLKLDQGKSFFQEWNLQSDLGMSCGGVAHLFFEIHHPKKKWNIVIFGAGHVSQELVRVLLRLDCHLTCIDSRPEWLEKLPSGLNLEKFCYSDLSVYVEKLTNLNFVVIATMGHTTDLPVLQKIISSNLNLPYVGVIGSDIKAKKLRQNILEAGFSETQAQSFFCPIGEDIGNNTPPEIAISITSQLLKARDQFDQKEVKK